MPSNRELRVAGKGVVHEIIDGEAIIINLDTGCYYNTDKVGAEVWNLIQEGSSQSGIIASISSRYQTSVRDVATAIEKLVRQMLDEQLIVISDSPAASDRPVAEVPASPEPRPEFEPPVLEKHVELTDFLLVDPIHEVDERGLPDKPDRVDPDSKS